MQNLTVPPRPWLRFYPKGVPASIDYPNKPVQHFLSESAKKYPARIALNFQGKRITYRELDQLSNKFANGLISLGITKGSRVAIILPNCPQFVISYYGAMKTGATIVTCNPLYKERELEFQLNDSGCEAAVLMNNVIAPNDFFGEFEKCRPRLQKMKHVFVTSITDYLPPIKKQLAGPVRKIKTVRKKNTISFTTFLSKQTANDPGMDSQINPKMDLAALQYTGGTTGTSKGAMLTHYNLVTNAVVSSVWGQLSNESERVLAVIPFFHIYGMTNALNSPVYAGQEIFLLPTFNVKEVLETLHKERISLFPGVATMYIALLNYPELSKYSIRSVRRCLSGAAPLPFEVQRKFNEVTGGNLVEGYGLTEASPVTHCNPFGNDVLVKSGSIGVPVPDTDAKIVDMETGSKDLVAGEVGELAVKGPQVMKGYWNQPDETSNVLKQDGWLLTGDIAKADDDGYFYIVDRKKDMIDASGFKVWPREVEEVLYSHPDIKEAAVVGVKDPYRGETVMAYVVLKDKSKNPGTESIRTFCKEKMVSYKVPKIIEFRDDLPKSLIGKVLRRKLREEGKTGQL
ncbi:MAG: long-chain-fatty-acid--CoA ligase [Nitrososphaerales archaeon]